VKGSKGEMSDDDLGTVGRYNGDGVAPTNTRGAAGEGLGEECRRRPELGEGQPKPGACNGESIAMAGSGGGLENRPCVGAMQVGQEMG